MRLITRRHILVAFAATVGFLLVGQDISAQQIKVDEDNKICGAEAKAKIQDVISRMLDGLEEISGNELSETERARILNEAWYHNKRLILTRYSFKD